VAAVDLLAGDGEAAMLWAATVRDMPEFIPATSRTVVEGPNLNTLKRRTCKV